MGYLVECPHCGRSDTLGFCDRKELEECPAFDDCDMECSECDRYDKWTCVVCCVNLGGCGASGGYASCEAKAAEEWNARPSAYVVTEMAPSGNTRDKCSHCGVTVNCTDQFCRGCGRRFVG